MRQLLPNQFHTLALHGFPYRLRRRFPIKMRETTPFLKQVEWESKRAPRLYEFLRLPTQQLYLALRVEPDRSPRLLNDWASR
ncbi:hypothetical protein Nwat_1332 [Nitrosococcus watsonii C-113]|uniref:Uncharacterized protein n=1 Tax=Nitrosococcus watsoni (strain C-113) TaxID=105559 RepID=D8K5S5_NITWC|nr:hypothetical protein Nwat_1332 [Nitrosococcus watsonii C-113]